MEPIASERLEPHGPRSSRPVGSPPSRSTARVLLVDGNSGSRGALAELLAEEGFEVRTAATAQQGLALARTFRPDIALIELRMPVMSGLELLRELKHNELPVKAMLMTAGANLGTQQQSRRLGAVDLLEKPLDFDDVVLRIRAALAMTRQEPLAHA